MIKSILNIIKVNKFYLILGAILLVILYISFLNTTLNDEIKKNISLTNKYVQMNSNFRAGEDNNRALILTLDQFQYSNDSILNKLDSIKKSFQKKLKIKDNKITTLQWYKDNFKKGDTIKFNDTIFVESFKKDTIIGDKYYKLNLKLEYPSTISTSIEVFNEKTVISYLEKETVEPKKSWPWWWFQKKQLVEKIEVRDSNPYIKNEDKVIVKIIDPKTFKEKKK